MKKFKYHALNHDGQEVIGIVEARHEIDVINLTRSKGLYPTILTEVIEKDNHNVIEVEAVKSTSAFTIPWRDVFLVLLGFLLHWLITAIS